MFEFSDEAFARVQPLLPVNSPRGKPWREHRQVLGGILWKLHTGRPWRDLPERFGPWQTYGRLRRWQRDGPGPDSGRWWAPASTTQPTTAVGRRCWRRRQ